MARNFAVLGPLCGICRLRDSTFDASRSMRWKNQKRLRELPRFLPRRPTGAKEHRSRSALLVSPQENISRNLRLSADRPQSRSFQIGVIGQRQRRGGSVWIRPTHGDVFTLPDDLKPQRLQRRDDPLEWSIDRKFHATPTVPSATYAASTSLSSSKASAPKVSM